MSWLDGMVDEGEAASQDQRLGRTTERLAPGMFEGSYDALGKGLVRGVIEGGAAVKSLYLNAALTGGAEQNIFDFTKSTVMDDAGKAKIESDLGQLQKDTAASVIDLRPDPKEVGFVGQILGEAAAVLPRTVIGTMAGGIAGGAVAAGLPAGVSGKYVGMAEGLDEGTATIKGGIDALTTGVGAVMPAARFVKPVLGDAAIAVGANVGLGMAGRGATAALLDNNGYHAQAAQYRAMDGTAIATDAILGAAFFGIGRASMRKPTTAQVDAALAERATQHFDVDTAPGVPINPRSAVAHQDAIRSAINQLSRGEPVVLPESIHTADFMRGADEPRPISPTRDEAVATARQDLEPTLRLELEQEAAGMLPNVRDLKTELAAVGRNLAGLDETFSARAKEFQQQGQGRKKAETSARKAIESERQQLTDQQAQLAGGLEGNRSAELARADIAAMDRGETPQRFQDRITRRADEIAQGFERKPLAAGVAEGNKLSMAQIARQEIGRILDDLERAEPTLQAKPLDIGTPKVVKTPATDSPPGGKAGSAKVTTPDSSGPAVATEGGNTAAKDAADPTVQVADEVLARVDDMRISTGATDADGEPITVSARELMAQADADIARAQEDSKGFAAAAACFFQRGES